MRCCRFSTCVGYRLATSRKPSPPSWAKRAEPVAGGDLAADGRMAGGLRRLAEARPLARRCVYVWADGVYLQARMEEDAECMLVLIGATPEGKKELVGFQTGVREGAQSWRELLIDIKQRGLEIAPDLAVGDGALGFWKAIEEVFPSTRHQRCWVHKTANVLNKVALAVQVNMKVDLREIYAAPTRAAAEAAIDVFAYKS
jgi:putative transposase